MTENQEDDPKDKLKSVEQAHAKLSRKLLKAKAKVERRSRRIEQLSAKLGRISQNWPADDERRKALVVFNPNAGGLKKDQISIHDIIERLDGSGIDARFVYKSPRKMARKAIQEAIKTEGIMIIAAGGDGTIEKVAACMVKTGAPLGILPLGTMNNLAKALGLPLTLEEACETIAHGQPHPIDVGHIHSGTSEKRNRTGYFLETAGIGMSALAAPAGQSVEKGRWSEAMRKIQKLLTLDATHLKVTCDDGTLIHAEAQMVILANAPFTGPEARLAPDARMDDGYLDAVVYAGMNKLQLTGYFLAATNRRSVNDSQVVTRLVQKLEVESEDALAAHADMDVFPERRKWNIEVLPGALQVILSSAGEAPGLVRTSQQDLANPEAPEEGKKAEEAR